MTLQERLTADLRTALKTGDKTRRSVIRMIIAGIKNAEIAKNAPLDDAGVTDVLTKKVKQHRESITEFAKGKRQDLVAKEEAELAIVLEYLPKQMSRDEIAVAARQVMEQVGARGPGDKGKVMSRLMPQHKGKADGREVSDVVSELLAG